MFLKCGVVLIMIIGVCGSYLVRCDENVMFGGLVVECLSLEDDVMGYLRGDGKMMLIN